MAARLRRTPCRSARARRHYHRRSCWTYDVARLYGEHVGPGGGALCLGCAGGVHGLPRYVNLLRRLPNRGAGGSRRPGELSEVRALNALVISGREVLPLVEGGKGISVSNGESSGAWAACGGVATFSGVNADSYDAEGNPIQQRYFGRTRRERHEELIRYAIAGGIEQARVAWELSRGQGRIHMNVLWEMAAAERILHGVLEGAKGIINGVTCGAGMPYRIAEICAKYGVHYYPIVSSGRAFSDLWKRAHHK